MGADELRADKTQTPGMRRFAAVDQDGLWSGVARTAPGMTSGWHHHGDHESVIYVAEGGLVMEHGAGGRERFEAQAGDFVVVPKGAIHRESNPSTAESVLVVTRAGSGPAVVNVEGPGDG